MTKLSDAQRRRCQVGDLEIVLDDGCDLFDDVQLKISHLDEIYSSPSVRIHSPKQLKKDEPK